LKRLLAFVGILSCFDNVGMEPAQNNVQLFKSVEKLLENKGHDLKKWVQEENDGEYSYDLSKACVTLEKFFSCENISDIVNKYDPQVIHRAQLIAERQGDRAKFMEAMHSYDFPKADKIIENNPDIANAYQNYGLCGGDYTPLHEFVEADDAGAVDHLLTHSWCWKLNKNAWGGAGFDANEPVICSAKSTYVMKQLLEANVDLRKKSRLDDENVLSCLLKNKGTFSFDLADCVIKHAGKDFIFIMINDCSRSSFGNTLLHECIQYGYRYDVIRFLLHHKANPFQPNNEGKTPLQLAIKKKKTEELRLFKERNIFFVPFTAGDIIALLQNNAQELKRLFKQGSAVEKYTMRNLLAELFIVLNHHSSSHSASMDGIMMLREGWCFNNATYDDLQRLVGKEAIEYVKSILYKISRTARECASNDAKNFQKMIEQNTFVLQYNKQIVFEMIAQLIKNNNEDLCKDAISYYPGDPFKPDITGVDENKNTLLHYAVQLNKPWAVDVLAGQPALVSQRNNQGQTALDIAAASENKACLRALLNCIFFNWEGYCFEGFLYREEMKKLFESIHNVHALTVDGIPLLHRAVQTGWFELCEIVLEKGADINEKDKHGKTALWYVETRNILTLLMGYALRMGHGPILSQKMIDHHKPGGLRIILEKCYKIQEEERSCKK
jgi:ankyrin repeat protein